MKRMKGLTIEEILLHLNEVLNLLPSSIYLKNADGVYLGCNKFQAEMAGFESPEDIIGKTDYDLPWKNEADVVRAADKRVMETGVAEEILERGTLHDGSTIIMLGVKSPFRDETGKIIGIVGISLDITARQQAEERERVATEKLIYSELKKKFEGESKKLIAILAGGIGHDLRSPLLSLASVSHVLKMVLPDLVDAYQLNQPQQTELTQDLGLEKRNLIEEVLEFPQRMDKQIARMHSFIDDNLKAIKRGLSEQVTEEDLVKCISYKLIGYALDSYAFQPEERELIEWDRRYYFDFMGNPLLFMRIIYNLLSNALYQIHQNQKGKIFISSEETPESNIIRFKDTAGGASPDIVDHIFDGYVTTKENGTGVGLASARITMQSFKGRISCHSVEGDYIEFVLEFPKIAKETEKI
jgi:PAS domain S-box-containing protein